MRYPFIKLPKNVEMALFLIGEELKTRKFFNGLRNLGLDDCSYEHHFNSPIAHYMGLEDHSDTMYSRIDDLLEKHAEKVDADDSESVMKQVLRAYVDLVIERRAQHRNKFRKESKSAELPTKAESKTARQDLRDLSPFESISIETFADIVLRQGDKEEIEIFSSTNPENYIVVFVENKRLFISTGKIDPSPLQTTIYITYKKLNGLLVDHCGRITTDGTIETDRLGVVQNGRGSIELDVDTLVIDLTLTKSGTLTITGSSDDTIALNTGTANIDGSGFETTSAKVTIKDTGNVLLAIEDEVTARLDGSGCLEYSGSPRLKALSGDGTGTLKQIKTSVHGEETEEEEQEA